jgi:hypothetical protein
MINGAGDKKAREYPEGDTPLPGRIKGSSEGVSKALEDV